MAATYAQTPTVAQGGVLNAANGMSPVAAGSLVAIYGSDLAGGLAQADSIPLATALGDVTGVTFNGVDAPLLFVSGGQINAQLPWNVLSSGNVGTASVVVKRGNQASAAQTLQVGPFSPGIFEFLPNHIAVAEIYPDGAIAAPAGAITGVTSRPAKAGDLLVIYATGLGAVDFPAVTGSNSADHLRTATTWPTVLIGGKSAKVDFAGLTPQFVGVYQINVEVPSDVPTGSAVSLQLVQGGFTTDASITIAVGQ